MVFDDESRGRIMKITRRRFLKGYFTRTGHIDDTGDTALEDVKSLGKGESLVELYPGLAALLHTSGDFYTFDRVCPHALSERGVEELVQNWTGVFMAEARQEECALKGTEYFGPPEDFKIQ